MASGTIADLVQEDGIFVDGDWVETKDQDPHGDVRLIQLADVGDGFYRNKSIRFLTSKKAKELSCTFLEPGDLLIARMPDPLGRACIFPGDSKRSVTVVDVCVVRTGKGGTNHRWLMHRVNSAELRAAIAGLQSGSTRKRISRSNLARIRFSVPPLDQQQRIVAKIEKQFTRLDAGVASLKRVQTALKRYRATVLKAACEGRLVATEAELARKENRKYETGEQLLQRILKERREKWNDKRKYKEAPSPNTVNLPKLPEGWTWARLEQIGLVIGGLTKNPARAKLPKQLPYLRVANVYANELRLDSIETIGVKDSELKKLLLERGDLLVVEGNGSKDQIGRLAVWGGMIEPCVHQNHIIKVRLVEPTMAQWILSWLLSTAGRDYVELVASSTSGLYTLSVDKVGNLPIPIAPLQEQMRIVDEVERRLSIIEELTTVAEASFERATRLRNSILQAAFRGDCVGH
ncbi:MAG TPA: hypothetical protein VGM65_16595 [Candidatus Udaeobacter sp.]|jgi:type I restriction enzyme S subunit